MSKKEKEYPDHVSELNRINRVVGQLEGIKRMIEDRRYCPEILTQTRAVSSAIRALESAILEKHLQYCVMEALQSSNKKDADAKMKELLELFQKRS